MRAVIQRVRWASVVVDESTIAEIGPGLLTLVGATHDDGREDVVALVAKMLGLRIFRDDEGLMNRSVIEIGGSVLVVSQFTLYGSARKGRRPSFGAAARPEVAEPLIELFVSEITAQGVPAQSGRFGAMMDVRLSNDGPVTLILETEAGRVV